MFWIDSSIRRPAASDSRARASFNSPSSPMAMMEPMASTQSVASD